MTIPLLSWLGDPSEALGRLALRPVTLVLALLLVNAVVRPYGGFCHDARLYSAQVLNQAEAGCYADDLFFRYGSQDEFSVFSRLAAPLVWCLGIETTFFVLFVVLNALFFFALTRLVLVLVEDRAVAVLALLFMAVAPLPFSGLNVLQVQEPFLTPRVLANALVLFGLECLLRQRYLAALVLVAVALPVHPIMAFGGLLVCATYLACTWLPTRTAVTFVMGAALVGLAVIVYQPLGTRLFGTMDAPWRDMIRAATIFNFPLDWNASDWLNLAVSFAVLVGAVVGLPCLDAPRRRFALVLIVVGAAGFIGTFVGSVWPYALLFQGQPYRVLWIVKVAQVALGFVLIAQWGRSPRVLPRLGALGLAVFFCLTSYVNAEFLLLAVVVPFCCIGYRGIDATPRHPDWLWRAAVTSLAVGVALWAAFKWWVLIAFRDQLMPYIEPYDFYQRLVVNVGPPVTLMLCIWAVRCFDARGWLRSGRFAGACLGLGLAYHGAFFAIGALPAYRVHATRYGADMAVMQDYFAKHAAGRHTPPTVYCSLGCVNYLWIDLHAKSYFDWNQIVGVMFSRQTAVEAHRRALLVRAFEIARVRENLDLASEDVKTAVRLLYETDFDYPAPSVADLRRLCQEPELDFLILKQEFPGLAAAGSGKLFVYDCRQVRAALRLPEPGSAGGAGAAIVHADAHRDRPIP